MRDAPGLPIERGSIVLSEIVSATGRLRVGLGNELIPVAKAWLVAEALQVPMVPPAWGRNLFHYWRYFSRSPFDELPYHARLAFRRRMRITEAMYRATGIVDYGEAVREIARSSGRRGRIAIVSEGMWGGFPSIDRARPFVRRYLEQARFAGENYSAARAQIGPDDQVVAVHVRTAAEVDAGDFAQVGPDRAFDRRWNVSLPLSWYENVCDELKSALGPRARFLVLGPESAHARSLAARLDALTTWHRRYTDVSDLLLMAAASLVVCSVSSFSLVAAWLSGAPYIWPREQLDLREGWLSLWGDEPTQQTGLTAANRASLSAEPMQWERARGVPVSWDGKLPPGFGDLLDGRDERCWDRRTDLLYYGTVPADR